jgi:hypothetical protein
MAEVDIKCPCPGKPHETDTVILRDKLGLADGAAVQALILRQYRESDASKYADHTGMLAEAYVLRGVSSWTLVNAAGSALPVNADNIRAMLLDDFEVGYPVAEKADELYEGPVIRPLLKEESNSSEPTPTNGSTSPTSSEDTPQTTVSRPKRSKPSSTTTTPTVDTATTTGPLAGAFSYSQNSASAES